MNQRYAHLAVGGRPRSFHEWRPAAAEALRIDAGIAADAFVPAPAEVTGSEWRWDGAAWVHDPEEAPPSLPDDVTKLQLRRALRQVGLEAAMDAFLAAAPETVRADWGDAHRIRRLDPTVEIARIGLGVSPAQRDQIFALAATL